MSLEDKLVTILTKSIDQKAYQYLMNMRGSKGEEIIYSDLIMADYLMPNEENMTISDKRYIFSMRNRMLYLPHNFPSKETIENLTCSCGEPEDMKHVYICKLWNQKKEEDEYEMIFTDNLKEQTKVYKRFKVNYEERETYKNEKNKKNEDDASHEILIDPLFSVPSLVMEIN